MGEISKGLDAKLRILPRCPISRPFLVLVAALLRVPTKHRLNTWKKRKVEQSLFKISSVQKCGCRYFRDRTVTPEVSSLRAVMTSRPWNDKGREILWSTRATYLDYLRRAMSYSSIDTNISNVLAERDLLGPTCILPLPSSTTYIIPLPSKSLLGLSTIKEKHSEQEITDLVL